MQQGKIIGYLALFYWKKCFLPQITTLIVLKSQLHVCYFFRLTKKVLKHAIKQRTEKREQQTRQVEESLHTFFDICFRVFDISYLQHYTFSWRLLCMAPKHGRNRRQLPFNYLPLFCLRA